MTTQVSKVLLSLIASLVFVLLLVVQGVLFSALVTDNIAVSQSMLSSVWVWLAVHVLSSLVASAAVAVISLKMFPTESVRNRLLGVFVLCGCLSVLLPFVGLLGITLSLGLGMHYSGTRHREDVYWQFTNNAALPFTTPVGRQQGNYDSRGFLEQLMYSVDNAELYRKVLATTNIRASLSVGVLKKAVQHSDEKIRLTAYQTLDRKVTHLNREIQRLENSASKMQDEEKSNTWLQIASNYWELLTLEKDEPVARKQLLDKSEAAAIKAVGIMPENRNAHFTLGRVSLMQGNPDRASIAFKKSISLGMPKEKIIPYLAEAAYGKRDFKEVTRLLDSMDNAFKLYPPLCHVAEYWK